MADLRVYVLSRNLVASLRVGRQHLAVDAKIPQPSGTDVAGIPHVGYQPRSLLGGIVCASYQLVPHKLRLCTLVYDSLVSLRSSYERGIVGLSIGKQNKHRLVRCLLDLFFLVDLQAVRPTGEVHHSDGEKIRLLGDVHMRFEYLDALDPELIVHHSFQIYVHELVLKVYLGDIVKSPCL